jgi:hypothetical protein
VLSKLTNQQISLALLPKHVPQLPAVNSVLTFLCIQIESGQMSAKVQEKGKAAHGGVLQVTQNWSNLGGDSTKE